MKVAAPAPVLSRTKGTWPPGDRAAASRVSGSVRASKRRPRVLLIFNYTWDDAKAILMGVSRYARGDWDVLIDAQAAAMEDGWWIAETKWDGVITRHTSRALVAACRQRRIPLIDLDDAPQIPNLPKVRPNNLAVGHMGAEYFLDLGFRHFAFCGLTESWAVEREAGFVEALELAGRNCAVIEAKYRMVDPTYDEEQLAEIRRWLDDLPRPLAVMTCNDLRALQVTRACRASDIAVPNEISVLGVNNDYVRCEFAQPSISSVATDRQLAGFRAAEILDRMMRSGAWSGHDDVRIDPIRVVVRHSTDLLAIDDRAVCSAVRYIREHACEGISAQNVANHIGLPRHVLERRYRKLVGRTPHAEIRLAQIGRIKQLLAETDLPLKNIADLVGIAHTEYINVVFSRETGMTPGEFRRTRQPKKSDWRLASATAPDLAEEL